MPQAGDDPVSAVELAARRLRESGSPGSIVLVADSIDPAMFEGLARVHREQGVDIHVYAVAAGPEVVPPADSPPAPFLDEDGMRKAAADGPVHSVSVDTWGVDYGYLDARGGADLSVVIRTLLLRGGRAYLHTGGAVVADSDPREEWRETLDKARPLLAALDEVGEAS